MLYAEYRLNEKEGAKLEAGISRLHEDFFRRTFSPSIDIEEVIEFKVKGGSYAERKAYLREQAVRWSCCEKPSLSYGEFWEVGNYFATNGKRYGLLTEFRENGIC